MASVTESQFTRHTRFAAWLPLVVLPVAALLGASGWPPPVFMWTLALSIYAGLKWLSFADCIATTKATVGSSLGYLLFWPGMDAKSFFASPKPANRPSRREWISAFAKVALGFVLVVVAVRLVDPHPTIAGWIGMVGIVFTLHFGLFHWLSVLWRQAGVDAPPIMNSPLLASSLSDFWGKRWNVAFRDLAHPYVLRPFVGRLGIAGATMAAFVVSGVVHDAVISIPAGGGFGLPTLYFVIQGLGLLFERSRVGKKVGARNGVIGRVFCGAVTMGPIFLLFHQPFVERVIVPMLTFIGSI